MQTPQQPLGSGFGHGSTAAEVIAGHDLSGKTAFVTGGYSGLGTETVKALVSAGARVIIGGRRPEAAKETLADIIGSVTVLKLELDDPASVDALAEAVAKETGSLDLVINNAAIMANPLTRDARGYESQFATNQLGHFQLTARLWPLLREGARVIALSSLAHKRSAFHPEDPNYENRPYDKWEAYGQAKTANALFALHLDTLAQARGIRAWSVHPGGIMTNLGRYLDENDIALLRARAAGEPGSGPSITWKTPEQGAATTIWAATSPLLEGKGGAYCEDCDVAALVAEGADSPGGVVAHACDPGAAAALWEISEKLTGIKFDPVK